jgi:hypothetical protein
MTPEQQQKLFPVPDNVRVPISIILNIAEPVTDFSEDLKFLHLKKHKILIWFH